MDARTRYLATLLFQAPDRIPFCPGRPRESTFTAWHGQGLPDGVDWLAFLADHLGLPPDAVAPEEWLDVNLVMRPEFEQKILERRPGTLIVQDWKGNICEIADAYGPAYLGGAGGKFDFVTRSWIKCPVENRDDWERMKTRYDAGDPARFPADFAVRCARWRSRRHVLRLGFSGVFWQLREWMGFEGLCLALLEQPELVRDMIRFWEAFIAAMLEKIFRDIVPDSVLINEDMAYKEKAMISVAMTRDFIAPTWRRWGERVHQAGCPLYTVDSDGYVGELIPLWIEAGVQVNEPQEVAAGNDLPAYRRRFERRMAYSGGVDKRAMAKGGAVIRRELERLAPAIRAGGYLPSCDHGIPPDVSWPAMVDYSRLLAQATGWL